MYLESDSAQHKDWSANDNKERQQTKNSFQVNNQHQRRKHNFSTNSVKLFQLEQVEFGKWNGKRVHRLRFQF